MLQGYHLFMYGDYEGSLEKYRHAIVEARDRTPADSALYNIGLIYAHPDNPKRDNQQAIKSFSRVITEYPQSPWAEQARIWASVLSQTEKSKQEAENSRQEMEKSKQALERTQQDLEKFKEIVEKSKQEVDRTRQEMEKSKQVLERANRIDIEIDQKKRERGK